MNALCTRRLKLAALFLTALAGLVNVPTLSRADYVVYIRYDRYAAIAYSEATGRWGYSYNYTSLGTAQSVAMANCNASDARPLTWAKNGHYCALAVGDGRTYGYGSGPTAASARAQALNECSKRSSNCRIAVCVYSGN